MVSRTGITVGIGKVIGSGARTNKGTHLGWHV